MAAGGGNAAAAVVAGTGAAAAEDHCTSLSLDCGESGGEREKLDDVVVVEMIDEQVNHMICLRVQSC